MVTRRQIKALKNKIDKILSEISPDEIDKVEIYFINDDNTLITPEGEVITEKEYEERIKEEKAKGERIIEI